MTLVTAGTVAPRSRAVRIAASVSAVSPDCEMPMTRSSAPTTGLRYRNSDAVSASAGIRASSSTPPKPSVTRSKASRELVAQAAPGHRHQGAGGHVSQALAAATQQDNQASEQIIDGQEVGRGEKEAERVEGKQIEHDHENGHEHGERMSRLLRQSLRYDFLGHVEKVPGFGEHARQDERATAALILAIFVPKCGDIGAYFTGRLLGRHPMAPTLSPKKTWEGAVGGVAAAVLATIGMEYFVPVVRGGWASAASLGATLGIVGILGDLAESLIKRDARQKDASQVVPGFGGVLDVVDSILFAAPVAYWWIK